MSNRKTLDDNDEYSYQIDNDYIIHLFRNEEERYDLLTNPLIAAIFRIEELEKENAELKKELNYAETHCLFHSDCPVQKDKQLIKAKELLNEFLDFEASCMERGIYISDKIRAEAEQFLNSEVEK